MIEVTFAYCNQHTLRMAASEAKALGVSTFKELTIPQRSWIHDRVGFIFC